MITRRTLVASLGAAVAGTAAMALLAWTKARGADWPGELTEIGPTIEDGVATYRIDAAESRFPLLGPDRPSSPLWLYSGRLLPVIRARRGAPMRVRFGNELPSEHSTVHWHGIRVPNGMDGVPNITQKPVMRGESFVYEFTPPDAGTFFFHPHCNEAAQVGQGLAGILIVEGDAESDAFDEDVVLAARDWRLKPDGSFDPFVTVRGASRAGTFGAVRTVNGGPSVSRTVAASADLRIRLLNLDPSRVIEVGQEGGEAFVIAIDGNAVTPFPLDTWRLGPAMRLDLALRTPQAGRAVRIMDYAPADIFTLATFNAEGASRRSGAFLPSRLNASPIPEPNLAAAESQVYVFGPASDSIASFVEGLDPDDPFAATLLDSLCTGSDTFWSINKVSWPKDGHERVPPPLARLEAGRTYRFTLQNATPHSHPIHLHGHSFKVLGSSKRRSPEHFADTVLLAPKERLDIAFVAREGNWMLHCHILEHLETGMMGYLRVT
jgi:FtsP/CotA-like multicopper oxidase with cupredoxin domain